MYHFVFPETGMPAPLVNRLLDGPFADEQDAIEKFQMQWPEQEHIRSPNPSRDLAVFLNNSTGEIVVLRRCAAKPTDE